MRFPAKTVAIYPSKKTDFESKNNNGGNILAHLWLADS